MEERETFTEYCPVRCTCGKVLGLYWNEYEREVKSRTGFILGQDVSLKEKQDQLDRIKEIVLNDLGVKRYCCRMNMLSPSLQYTGVQQDDELVSGLKTLHVHQPTVPTVLTTPIHAEKKIVAGKGKSEAMRLHQMISEEEEPSKAKESVIPALKSQKPKDTTEYKYVDVGSGYFTRKQKTMIFFAR